MESSPGSIVLASEDGITVEKSVRTKIQLAEVDMNELEAIFAASGSVTRFGGFTTAMFSTFVSAGLSALALTGTVQVVAICIAAFSLIATLGGGVLTWDKRAEVKSLKERLLRHTSTVEHQYIRSKFDD